jgi:hypothetical protein
VSRKRFDGIWKAGDGLVEPFQRPVSRAGHVAGDFQGAHLRAGPHVFVVVFGVVFESLDEFRERLAGFVRPIRLNEARVEHCQLLVGRILQGSSWRIGR